MKEVWQNEEDTNVVDDTLEAWSKKDAFSRPRRGGERISGQGLLRAKR